MRTMPEGFDWLEVLEQLKAEGVTDENIPELCEMASQWPTCACGQLCRALPRNSEGCPLDHELHTLGGVFYQEFKASHWCVALETFHKIEARTTLLLKEMFEAPECMIIPV